MSKIRKVVVQRVNETARCMGGRSLSPALSPSDATAMHCWGTSLHNDIALQSRCGVAI